jgi:pyridoxamine 5'-phosphate oxidase
VHDPSTDPPTAPVDPEALAAMRREYESSGLDLADLRPDPVAQFLEWFEVWRACEPEDANAMVVATADADGRASARTVLLKGADAGGFTFFTNYESRKARELAGTPWATLLFAWVPLRRQVIVAGRVERCSDEENDRYFASRPRGSQLGAWASSQSQVIADRSVLDERYRAFESQFDGQEVPRPPQWGGFRVVPETVELWQGRSNRLHDRLRYERDPSLDTGWRVVRLSP